MNAIGEPHNPVRKSDIFPGHGPSDTQASYLLQLALDRKEDFRWAGNFRASASFLPLTIFVTLCALADREDLSQKITLFVYAVMGLLIFALNCWFADIQRGWWSDQVRFKHEAERLLNAKPRKQKSKPPRVHLLTVLFILYWMLIAFFLSSLVGSKDETQDYLVRYPPFTPGGAEYDEQKQGRAVREAAAYWCAARLAGSDPLLVFVGGADASKLEGNLQKVYQDNHGLARARAEVLQKAVEAIVPAGSRPKSLILTSGTGHVDDRSEKSQTGLEADREATVLVFNSTGSRPESKQQRDALEACAAGGYASSR